MFRKKQPMVPAQSESTAFGSYWDRVDARLCNLSLLMGDIPRQVQRPAVLKNLLILMRQNWYATGALRGLDDPGCEVAGQYYDGATLIGSMDRTTGQIEAFGSDTLPPDGQRYKDGDFMMRMARDDAEREFYDPTYINKGLFRILSVTYPELRLHYEPVPPVLLAPDPLLAAAAIYNVVRHP